ncbi:MAG: metallophosphoesterase family protein [Gemmatimonadota bacterium]
MHIGLISDTHGLLRPEVFSVFEGVQHILHAGDVGDPDILTELEAVAPLTAVWGNTDSWELRDRLPERAEVSLGGLPVVVIHGQQYGSPRAREVGGANPDVRLVVFGHSHRPEVERVDDCLAVNPGSAGPARFKLPVTVAIAELTGTSVEARIVDLRKL